MLWKEFYKTPYEQVHKMCEEKFYIHRHCYRYHSNKKINIPTVEVKDEQHFGNDYDCLPKNESTVIAKYRYPVGHPFLQELADYLKFKYIYVALNVQESGMLTPRHFDRNRCFANYISEEYLNTAQVDDIKKVIYFPDDQKPGQMFQIGEDFLKWQAGDMFEWEWWAPHSASNCGLHPRRSLTIIGIR